MTAPTALLLGALDTKGTEYAFVKERLEESGIKVVMVDFGVRGEPLTPADIDRDAVACAGGAALSDLVKGDDRGVAMAVMAQGARAIARELARAGRIQGALAMGGTGGTSVAAEAFRELPLGFPRLIVSTAASGNTQPYIGESDLILAPSVVDIAGLNRISTRILANAAAALSGMLTAPPVREGASRPLIAASMFGVTTPSVTAARERLEALGYEVLVFHMTGSGGKAMESLIRQGYVDGVLDITTTELADLEVGGVFSAGPERLTAASSTGIPQLVSTGALDMVNFGARETVPAPFATRLLYEHNSNVTLMRTTAAECRSIGSDLARKVAASTGPAVVVLPRGGISALAVPGGPFHDTEADEVLFDAIRTGLEGSPVQLIESPLDINDPQFARELADHLDALIRSTQIIPSTVFTGK